MAEYTEEYHSNQERQTALDTAHGNSYVMLHDDHYPDHTPESPHGLLTFDTAEDIPPIPPYSTHIATLTAIDTGAVRPATVSREYIGHTLVTHAFVTQAVRDQYVAGDIAVGDIVLVDYLEDDLHEALVVAKVFKTW